MRIIRFYISSLIIFSFSIVFCEDRGIKLYNSNKFDEAKEFYENILLEREEDAFASFGLGSTAFQQNDYSLAMKGFESALNTENIELKSSAYYNMANVLAEEQRFEESLKFYRQSLVLNPNDIDSKINYELIKFKLQEQKNDENQQNNDDKDGNKDQNKAKESKDNNDNQNEDQDNQADSSEQNNEEQQNSEKNNKKEDKEEESKSQHDQGNDKKQIPQDKQNATAILDALKNNEKINKKIQISQSKKRKLEKDW